MYSADELYRSDFFPGLGWMLTKSIWDELSPKWPKAYPFSIVYIVLKSGFYSVSRGILLTFP